MAQIGIWNSKGGVVLNKYLVARIFAFDDHESEARAACVAKGWEDVRRGPLWLVPLVKAKNKIDPLYAGTKHKVDPDYAAATSLCEFSPDRGKLAVMGNNTRVAFYDVATGARKLRPKQPRRPALPDQFAALSLSFQIGGPSGPSARRKRASAKFSPRATSRAAVVTPDEKENAPAPFSAELTAGAFDDYGDCKQS